MLDERRIKQLMRGANRVPTVGEFPRDISIADRFTEVEPGQNRMLRGAMARLKAGKPWNTKIHTKGRIKSRNEFIAEQKQLVELNIKRKLEAEAGQSSSEQGTEMATFEVVNSDKDIQIAN